MRFFVCPAQWNSPEDAGERYSLVYAAPMECYSQRISYFFNEWLLGWNDSLGRLRGDTKRVERQSEVMLLADGLSGLPSRCPAWTQSYGFLGLYSAYNKTTSPATLADALAGNNLAGDSQCFDAQRHGKRINVGFLDGHAEEVPLTAGSLKR